MAHVQCSKAWPAVTEGLRYVQPTPYSQLGSLIAQQLPQLLAGGRQCIEAFCRQQLEHYVLNALCQGDHGLLLAAWGTCTKKYP